MRRLIGVVAMALLCASASYGLSRDDNEDSDNDDIPLEPTLPQGSQSDAGVIDNAKATQFSEKLPKHLAEHYRKNGLDNIVYFSFCIAWHYNKHFHQLRHELNLRIPDIKTHPMNHPPTEQNAIIAKAIGYIQNFMFLMLLFGSFIFSSLNMSEPPAIKWMSENKMNAFMGIFFMGFISTNLMQTGAFEVYYNGHVIGSKLTDGKVPHVEELIRNLQMFGMNMGQSVGM